MKRDPRLHGLSEDHHHALVLARRLSGEAGALVPALVAELRARFDAELAPHFAREERVLLPALRRAGLPSLADRMMSDHDLLRAHLAAAEQGELERLGGFAALLTEHVRFEERELFPACEEHLGAEILDQLAGGARP